MFPCRGAPDLLFDHVLLRSSARSLDYLSAYKRKPIAYLLWPARPLFDLPHRRTARLAALE